MAAAGAVPGPEAITVSIVIYDDGGTIEAVLDAVAGLERAAERVASVLVIDNASRDDGATRAERHRSRPRVVRRGVNDGPCGARNLGLSLATTRLVLLLDGDVVPRSDGLELLLDEIAAPGVAIAMPRAVLAADPRTVHYDGGSLHYAGIMCLPNLLAPVAGADPGPARDVDAVVSMALLVERQAVIDAGGWDEAFFILFEDHDLSYRLRAEGLRLRFCPRAVVLHHAGTAGISFRPGDRAYPARRAFLHGRNRAYLLAKGMSWPALLLGWPGRLLFDLAYLSFALRRGVGLAWIRGRLAALLLLPRALAWRRLLAARRRVGDGLLLGCAPLTVSPVAAARGLEARLSTTLDGLLAAWWKATARLLPGRRAPPAGPPAGP